MSSAIGISVSSASLNASFWPSKLLKWLYKSSIFMSLLFVFVLLIDFFRDFQNFFGCVFAMLSNL